MAEKSPFFRPSGSSQHRMVVRDQQTPGGTTRRVQKEDTEHKSGLVGCASNLVNAIVGCGIVGIPYAIRQSGFVAGIVLVLFCAAVTEKSLRLLVNTAKHVHVPTYETLAEACFGHVGFRFIVINMAITSLGAMVSYLMLVKDSFGTLILENYEFWKRGGDEDVTAKDEAFLKRTILLIISLSVMLPLSCKRDMADLAQTSRVNVLIDALLVGLVVYNAPSREAAQHAAEHPTNFWIRGETLFIGLGVLSFAFVCQHASFIIAGSLENPTVERWGTVTRGALSMCAVLALLCGVSGYLGYREHTQGSILDNMDPSSATANIARLMIGIALMFVYPLENHVFRHASLVLLFKGRAAHEGDDSLILARRDRRVILTTSIYILSVIPALVAEDLGPVLAITGAVGGSCLSYLGPGAVYLGIHGERFLELVRQAWGETSGDGDDPEKSDAVPDQGLLVVSPASAKKPVAETTHLLGGGNTATVISGQNDASLNLPEIHGFFKLVLWYGLGMPIWCGIAKIGKVKLDEHVHAMALKSPHPIRIGDVEYKRLVLKSKTSGKESLSVRFQKLAKQNSLSRGELKKLQAESSSGPLPSLNQQIGKELLEQQQDRKSSSKTLEPDPQAAPPSWLDFYIAISFILLGIIALFAGIYSIFLDSD